jgi:phosphoribosylanthranilate isomerase
MKIKVCGITLFEQMVELQNGAADYVGLIFYEGSKRFVGDKLHAEKEAIRDLKISKVGVFVNAKTEEVEKAIADYGLSVVQLHGAETPETCAALMSKVSVIKAFQIAEETDIDELVTPYRDACNYYLFDKATASYGGSGARFDWKKLDAAVIGKLFFLSGGIAPEDAARLAARPHSFLYGVDINSRFESSPGVKDLPAVTAFINQLKKHYD